MSMTATATRTGEVGQEAISEFSAQIRGDVFEPRTPGYDDVRQIYNAMHDKYPAAIVRAADAADVSTAVRFALEQDLPIAIRSGGHNVAGLASVDGGLVIDMTRISNVFVNPDARTARVGGGADWGAVDHATHQFGLATPGGLISTTGVAGLALGGGFGHLSRSYGLCCDNIVSAEVVTASGDVVTASDNENADLFWAIRGGGGNFGVVTAFELKLHPVHTVYGGPVFYPAGASADVLAFYRDYIATAPREISAFFGYHEAPPAPFVPDELHGHKTCMIMTCWTGAPENAEQMLKPIRSAGPVALDLAGPIPYPALNSMFDALLPYGLHHYWKADFVGELNDASIGAHTHYGPQVPNFISLMHLYPMNGAIQDVDGGATAYAHRDAKFSHIIAGIDTDPANMPDITAWVRDYWSALHPHSSGAAYVNFLMDEGEDRIRATYGGNYARLVDAKRTWDPENVFHVNQNIRA
ncbi:FAD-binding oxidoreductase [soil metagenome]